MPTVATKTEVAIALLDQKLDSLISAESEHNKLLVSIMQTLSEHGTALAVHGQRLDGQRDALSGLEGRVNVWSGINTVGVAAASIFAWLLGRPK